MYFFPLPNCIMSLNPGDAIISNIALRTCSYHINKPFYIIERRSIYYLLDGGRTNFADTVDVVVDEPLIIASESLRPQVGPSKMGIRVLNSFHIRPLANYAKGNIKGNVLELTVHFALEGLEANINKKKYV